MSEPIAKHQIFEYNGSNPFHIINIYEVKEEQLLLSHWHTELEIAYNFTGYSKHYIDGECILSEPGKLVVTNSESVHNIIPFYETDNKLSVVAVVLLISHEYLEQCLPNFKSIYFLPSREKTRQEVKNIMRQISEYERKDNSRNYDFLYINSLVQMLLYYMCENGIEDKDIVLPVNYQKNIERLRGVMQYVEQHYKETITQSEVAVKFYFSKEYFARFFKKNTGMTFMEYVTKYRILKARQGLLQTDESILNIALDNGFSDSRRFINAFKSQYVLTPLQYRTAANARPSEPSNTSQ